MVRRWLRGIAAAEPRNRDPPQWWELMQDAELLAFQVVQEGAVTAVDSAMVR